MEKNRVKFFVVLEEHMLERYSYIIEKYNFENYCFQNFNNLQIGVSLQKILKRVKHRNILRIEYARLKQRISDLQKENIVESIYLSNSEGYIAHNVIIKLRKDFPNIELVGLQHGVFELVPPPNKLIRKVINNTINFLFGMFPLGLGFGEKNVDKYIVYNEKYRQFLINELKWEHDDVISDMSFLKAELYDKRQNGLKNESTVLFLMQCLSKSNMCSIEEEEYLNEKVIEFLTDKYEKVLVKNHPACINNSDKLLQNKKVEKIDNLIDGFNQCSYAYSYSSTALLEAEIFDIESFAINSQLVKEDKSIYKVFSNVISFENEIMKSFL